ncbi:MAG: hypothetical protein ACK4JY_08615 [Brevundimonas sp.]|uniref:hypothetical protein n=1 Tax=Brevundimonas sp. TaxID=1871086 RepID=UPI00391B42B7
MTAFTNLETAVLALICETDGRQLAPDQRQLLKSHLATAHVVERDNTGHGFYTTFEVDRSATPKLETISMIDAPNMIMEGLGEENALGFILWAEDGYPTTLEGFQYGDRAGQTVDLHDYDQTKLRFRETSWS